MDYRRETLISWEHIPHRFVEIDTDKLLSAVARRATSNKLRLPRWTANGILPLNARAFLTHVFFENAVNFCYTDPSGKTKESFTVRFGRQTLKGAMAMAACFHRAFGEKPIKAGDIIRHIETERSFARFFRGENKIPLIEERRQLLWETATILESFFDGDPFNVFVEGNFSAFGSKEEPGIVDLLMKRFPLAFGSDTAELDGRKFYFLKRPQLMVLEYHGRVSHKSDGLPAISGIERLGAIPDYELPKTFVADGIIQMRRDLAERIRDRKALPAGSREEIEIRAATCWAIYHEIDITNKARASVHLPPIHIGHIDYFRWTRGQQIKTPHMLVATTNY